MKIDLDLIEKMVAAGASGSVVLAYLRDLDAKAAPVRAKDKVRKRTERKRTNVDIPRTSADTDRQEATLTDTPRARLFREGSAVLMTMGRTERAARGMIAGWLKLTNDDDQLVTATILRAQGMAVADAAGWITASLKGKTNAATGKRSNSDVADDLIARATEKDRTLDLDPADYRDTGT